MRLIECVTIPKTGDINKNEDGFFIGDFFVAVIDGATAKKQGEIKGISSGRFAMLAIKEAFGKAKPDWKPVEVVRFLNEELKAAIKKCGIINFADVPIASVVFCNLSRKEIVSYGDCVYRINKTEFRKTKTADMLCAKKRAAIIKRALCDGVTIEQIRENDIGRAAILDELVRQSEYANCDCENGFACINGGETIERFLEVRKVKSTDKIVLSSDGYPVLCDTLDETERKLADLLKKDILCINELCGTKCVLKGNLSYDDRTYIGFCL